MSLNRCQHGLHIYSPNLMRSSSKLDKQMLQLVVNWTTIMKRNLSFEYLFAKGVDGIGFYWEEIFFFSFSFDSSHRIINYPLSRVGRVVS